MAHMESCMIGAKGCRILSINSTSCETGARFGSLAREGPRLESLGGAGFRA